MDYQFKDLSYLQAKRLKLLELVEINQKLKSDLLKIKDSKAKPINMSELHVDYFKE